MKKNGVFSFIIEMLILFISLLICLLICDKRRIFAQEETNNHTGKSWHYLYKMAKSRKNVDIFILGNSRTYTGLRPEAISENLGKTCFLLCSQGIMISDAYFMLEEALTLFHPKTVVIETYLLRDFEQKMMSGNNLNSQFHSFENRRNTRLKLMSTPELFSVDNAPYAWSRTLRNHSYVFDNPQLVRYNMAHPEPPRYTDKEYLGRFLCFNTGITASTLEKYKTQGAPVDGKKFKISEDAEKYLHKTLNLCRKNNVQVVFLTMPVYREHISHPEDYIARLAKITGKHPWINMQDPALYNYFTPDCFEDTYNQNQHMTTTGADIASRYLIFCLEMISRNRNNSQR